MHSSELPDLPALGSSWFAAVLDSIDDLVLVKDSQSRFVWANRACCDWYGMSEAELRRCVDADASDSHDPRHRREEDLWVVTHRRTLDIPAEPVTGHDGEVSYFHTRKNAVMADSGELLGTVGVSRSIEDRRSRAAGESKDRRALEPSLDELRIMVEQAPGCVAMIDVRLRPLVLSDSWRSLFEAQLGDTPAEPTDGMNRCFERLGITGAVSRAVHRGRAGQVAQIQLVDETHARTRHVDVEVRPWRWPEGAIGGAIVLVTDVTDRLLTERRLATANAELAHFNYRVSHDLVAPLKTTLGLVAMLDSMLGDDSTSSESRQMLGRIDRSLTALDRTLANVIAVARSDFEEHPPELVRIDRLLREVVRTVESEVGPDEATVLLSAQDVEVELPRERVAQILHHLIENSIHHSDRNRTDRWVRVTAERDGDHLLCFVRDNGIGLPPADDFDPFAAFSRGNGRHQGSGLGLYLVKKHVDALGGEVVARSDSGETVFRVRLPLATAGRSNTTTSSPSPASPCPRPEDLQR